MRDFERMEQKFMMGEVTAARVVTELQRYLPPDPHNGPHGYLVRSCYFDTPGDRDFEMKLAGHDLRRKIRLRVYEPEAETAIFEIKEKTGDVERKRSLEVSRFVAESFLDGDYSWLGEQDSKFLQALKREMEMLCYRPRCIVEYQRKAYQVPENETRVTFDRHVSATEASIDLFSPHLVTYPIMRTGALVMEVKYSNFLVSYVRMAMGEMLLQPEPVSKYCMARQISKHGRI